MKQDTFGKPFRLLTPAQFQHIFLKAEYKAEDDLLLLLARPNTLNYPRLGLVVPKKKIRHAVDRNRFKRLVRERFRKEKHALDSLDIIALAKKNLVSMEAFEQSKSVNAVFEKLIRKIN